MRILLIGFIVFVGWTVLSTYIYVCKIKGLCPQPQTTIVEETKQNEALTSEPKKEVKAEENVIEKAEIPKDLIIYFAFDKSDFFSSYGAIAYFNESNAYFLQNTQAKLNITGHADAIGTVEYNYALGLRRAQSLQKYFESKGVPSNRIRIESMGEKEPADDNSTALGRANNRRTVVTLK
jgi:outer membrane protein OmpA-like peptidoglycan-associated protein